MTGLLIGIHAIICICLAAIILMQSGRGGGLTEGFAAAESMFGAKTSSFMVKSTTIFAVIFLITCLSLAFISSRKNKSLMSSRIVEDSKIEAETLNLPGLQGDDSAPEIESLDDLLGPLETIELTPPTGGDLPVNE